jgi:hypothetical protein
MPPYVTSEPLLHLKVSLEMLMTHFLIFQTQWQQDV